MLGRVLAAPSRAIRLQTPVFRSFNTCAPRFESLPTRARMTKVASEGDFVRPKVEGSTLVSNVETPIAEPRNPEKVIEYGMEQAPNRDLTWSKSQRPKSEAMKGPRFEQMDPRFQPQSLSAMELINNQPVRMVNSRVVACDGGKSGSGVRRVLTF